MNPLLVPFRVILRGHMNVLLFMALLFLPCFLLEQTLIEQVAILVSDIAKDFKLHKQVVIALKPVPAAVAGFVCLPIILTAILVPIRLDAMNQPLSLTKLLGEILPSLSRGYYGLGLSLLRASYILVPIAGIGMLYSILVDHIASKSLLKITSIILVAAILSGTFKVMPILLSPWISILSQCSAATALNYAPTVLQRYLIGIAAIIAAMVVVALYPTLDLPGAALLARLDPGMVLGLTLFVEWLCLAVLGAIIMQAVTEQAQREIAAGLAR